MSKTFKYWIIMAFISFITMQIVFFTHVFTNNVWIVFLVAFITYTVIFFMRASIKKMFNKRAFKSARNFFQRFMMVIINATVLSFGIIALIVAFLSDGQLITYTTDDFLISGKWLTRYLIIYGVFWVVSFMITGFIFNV